MLLILHPFCCFYICVSVAEKIILLTLQRALGRPPNQELLRRTWEEYRTEKIDAGVFDRLFRMLPKQFDELCELLRPALVKQDSQYYRIFFDRS